MGDISQNTSYDNSPGLKFPALMRTIKKTQNRGQINPPSLMPAPSPANITTPFMGATQNEPVHPGVDIALPEGKGSPVTSFVPGIVVDISNDPNNFGNSIVVQDTEGNLHRYSHLDRAFVKIGQPVAQGQEIGTEGNSGPTYSPSGQGDGSHLDYRIFNTYQNKYLNPAQFIKK